MAYRLSGQNKNAGASPDCSASAYRYSYISLRYFTLRAGVIFILSASLNPAALGGLEIVADLADA